MSESQTLITGVYRTGSEYLSMLLNCHPDINVSMYSVNILRFAYGRYDPVWEESNYHQLLDDFSSRILERYNITLNKDEIVSELTKLDRFGYGELYDLIMSSMYLRNGITNWAEKCQLLWREIPDFIKMMPNGKVIHIIRDPRSVLASFKKYTYAEEPAYLGAIFNCFDSMLHAKKYTETISDESYRYVTYEALASNPQKVTSELWNFLGLRSGCSVTEAQNWNDSYGNKWYANSSFHKNTGANKFDTNASIHRWKNVLSNTEVEMVEGICMELLTYFGYEKSTITVDWLDIFRLFIKDNNISSYFSNWLNDGEGIEAFPTDPINPQNWEKPIGSSNEN